ncbi:MAG TPA: hypothetical protein DCR15_15270 [Arthrobacter bacterium]|jgi:aminopeptidase N|nr:hypothetical protein [Arthrobacter sp.]HAP90991.1 hypothetical protein [Arthrobacter sp.]
MAALLALARLSLDLVGLEVQSVTVDGQTATSNRAGDKLTVPAGYTAVANGTPTGETPRGSTTTLEAR